MELLIFVGLLAYFVAVRLTLSVERPAPPQHFAEMTHEFVTEQAEAIIGHGYEPFLSFLTMLGVFILISNLMGWFPA